MHHIKILKFANSGSSMFCFCHLNIGFVQVRCFHRLRSFPDEVVWQHHRAIQLRVRQRRIGKQGLQCRRERGYGKELWYEAAASMRRKPRDRGVETLFRVAIESAQDTSTMDIN